MFNVRQEVNERRDEEDAVVAARPSHMEKMADRKGSDATRSSGFQNLWMLPAQHKNYSGPRRNKNIMAVGCVAALKALGPVGEPCSCGAS